MNYRQFEIFVTTVEAGSVTAAAERLSLSQPAVSKSLRLLETTLGVQLFVRGAKGLRATDEGRALYLEASRLTDGYGHLEGFARNLVRMEHARLEISCIPALSLEWLPDTIASFVRDYPDATLSFRSRSSPETVQLVARGELDIGISQARADDETIEKFRLFDVKAVCIVPLGHRLALMPEITFADLHRERIISLSAPDEFRRTFEAAMLTRGFSVTSKIEVALGSMLCRMVEAGGGIGIIDEESARRHDPLRSRVLDFAETISSPIYLLSNGEKPRSLVAKMFTDHLIAITASRRGT